MIVAAGRRLVDERGGAFTTQELVKEAGVALQTFYRHFASKDELLLAVLEETIRENCAQYAEQAKDLPDPLARLRFYITAAISSLDVATASQRMFTTSEHYRLHQLYPDELAEADQFFTELLIPEIREAQALGLLAPHDVERDAWFVDQLVMATFHHYSFAHADHTNVAEDLWAFCLAALGAVPTAPAKERKPSPKASGARKKASRA